MHEGTVSEQAIPAIMCGSKVFGGVRGVDCCSVKELDEFAAR